MAMRQVEVEFLLTFNGNRRSEKVTLPMDSSSVSLTQTLQGKQKLAESYKFMFPAADKVQVGMTRFLD